jgi:hypothetical protein
MIFHDHPVQVSLVRAVFSTSGTVDHRNSLKFKMCFLFYTGRLTETPHRKSLPIFPHASQLKLMRLDHLLIHTHHLIISSRLWSLQSTPNRLPPWLSKQGQVQSTLQLFWNGVWFLLSWSTIHVLFLSIEKTITRQSKFGFGCNLQPCKIHQNSLDWFKGKSTGNHGFYH